MDAVIDKLRLIVIIDDATAFPQRLLIDNDVVLLHFSAEAQRVGDTGHGSQLQFDNPVLNRAEFLSALAATDELVEIDLAGSRSDGPHLRIEPRGDAVLGEGEPL